MPAVAGARLGPKPGKGDSLLISHMMAGIQLSEASLLPPEFALMGSWSQESELKIKASYFNVGVGHLNHYAKCLLLVLDS